MASHLDLDLDSQSDSNLDYSGVGDGRFSDNNSNSSDDVSINHGAPELGALGAHFDSPLSPLDLFAYVKDALNYGEKFNAIVDLVCMTRNSLLRQLKGMGWGGVYHSIGLDELVTAITIVVPISRSGSNWGIRTVATCLRSLLGLRVLHEVVRDALMSMQPEHMQRREVRTLFRGQYDITEPMILWHMDCKWIPLVLAPSYKLLNWLRV